MDAVVELSAHKLRELIGRKSLSPVELVDQCIDRIERVNPTVNAVVALDVERARTSAREAERAVARGDRLGPLHGLPVLIKDLTATSGLVTTRGSLLFKDNIPEADDLVVARIRAAGGIILGKTNTPEFGAGSNTVNRVYGACVNPFDTHLTCAGSSGGAAVALATDMVPLATGTDMGGSVRTPASFCGVVGHRCSPGLIPKPSRQMGWSTLGVDGPMARSVSDAALLLQACTGFDARDPLSQNVDPESFAALPSVDLSALRVAFSASLGDLPVARQVQEAFRSKAEKLEPLFGEVQWRHPDLGAVHDAFETLRGVEYLHSYGGFVENDRALLGPNVIANVVSARSITVEQVGRAMAEQTALFQRMQAFFEEFDLLVCPSAAVVPFPVEELAVREIDGEAMATYISWIAITYAITMTTHPVTVIPCGFGPTGMPFGIQIVGPARRDLWTMGAAAAIETVLRGDAELGRPRPDIDALAVRGPDTKAGIIPELLNTTAL